MFYIFYVFVWILSWLPMRVLFGISDLMYALVYYVVGYRKKVVRRNLLHAFPDRSLQEIIRIEKKFYHYFCDLMVEIIRQLHASKSEMKKRMTFENLDLLLRHAAEGRSVML